MNCMTMTWTISDVPDPNISLTHEVSLLRPCSADPRHLGALRGGGGLFHTVSNRAHGKRSSLQLVFFSRARDSPFTLHDLTDFYVERVTSGQTPKRN